MRHSRSIRQGRRAAYPSRYGSRVSCQVNVPSRSKTATQGMAAAARVAGIPAIYYFLILLIFEPCSERSAIRPFSANTKARMGFFMLALS